MCKSSNTKKRPRAAEFLQPLRQGLSKLSVGGVAYRMAHPLGAFDYHYTARPFNLDLAPEEHSRVDSHRPRFPRIRVKGAENLRQHASEEATDVNSN